MTDFRVDLGDGRTVRVSAETADQAANAARMFLANEKGSKPQGRSDAAANAFGQGASLGFGDELAAGVRAALPGFSNWMMRGPDLQRDASIGGSPQAQTVSDAPTTGQRYDEELARIRSQTQADHAAYPAMTTGANIAGGIATTAAALPAAATAAGPSLVGNMVKMGATGAGLGGLQGFAEGEGGFDQRLRSGMTGAAVGGAFGGALPVAGLAGRAALESKPGRWLSQNVVAPVAQRLAGAFEGTPARSLSAAAPDGSPGVTGGPLTQFAQTVEDPARVGALDRLATAFQRSGLSREQFDRKLAQLGPDAMLADLDQQLLSQARMANTMPGETRTVAKNVLEARDRNAGNRLVSAFEGNEAPPSSYDLGKAFDANTRAVGQRVYGDMADAGLKQTPELMALYENPSVKAAIDRVMAAEKATRIGTDRAPASPVEIMHKVKQAIWDLGFDKETARPGPMASWYRDLGVDYMNKLKAANPALAEADRAYAQAASLPEHFNAGRSFLRGGSTDAATDASAPALADLLARADVQQVAATKAGATNAAREKALEGTTPARALARRIDESTPVRDKLMQIYGSQQGGRIMNQAAAEKQFAETSNEILRGSKTADKLAEVFDNAGVRISPSGVQPRIWERLADILANLSGPNEAVRNQIGRMTLNPNADQNSRLLAEILARVDQRKSGRSLSAALAGSSGAQFGGP